MRCLLYPQKRTLPNNSWMSALCQKQTKSNASLRSIPKAGRGCEKNAALFIQLAPVKPPSLHRTRLGNHVARFSDCASCGKTGKARQPFAAFQSAGARSTCRTLRCFQHIKLEKGRSWSLDRPIAFSSKLQAIVGGRRCPSGWASLDGSTTDR